MKKKTKSSIFILILFIAICLNNVSSQSKFLKKNADETDYKLWSTTISKEISESGKWYSYKVSYENGIDTLYLKAIQKSSLYSFPGSKRNRFLREKWFCNLSSENELSVLSLITGKKEVIRNTIDFIFCREFESLFIITSENNEQRIIIKSLNKSETRTIDNISAFAFNEKKNKLIYSTINSNICSVFVLDMNVLKSELIIQSDQDYYSNFVWNQEALSAIFMSKEQTGNSESGALQKLMYYNTCAKKLHTFLPEDYSVANCSTSSAPPYISELVLSQDGSSVFFKIKNNEDEVNSKEKIIVQVWNASDKYLPTVKKNKDGSVKKPKTAVWYPESNEYKILTDTVYSEIMLAYKQQYAVLWNPAADEPQPRLNPSRDYKCVNLKNGKEIVFLKDFKYAPGKISVSPEGKYIAYFKNNHWWVYDIDKNAHTNLTQALRESFSFEDFDYTSDEIAYGNPGWTSGDKSILLYDKFDIWEVSPDALKARKITNGRQQNTTFRIVNSLDKKIQPSNFDGISASAIDLNETVLLQSKNEKENGFWWYENNSITIPAAISVNKISSPLMSKDNQTLIYKEENFDLSPQMMLIQKDKKIPLLIYQSNPHCRYFNQGKSKIIKFRSSRGHILNAAVFFPSDYNAEKSYPMIVHVYSRQAEKALEYVNPSLYSPAGFNVSHYTNNGYFVLFPDIIYESGNPGKSAADCVVSATKKILDELPLDPKRIGLIGHSFGGYEADFIITQTDMFSAAVAGAAITDLISSYLSLSWPFARPNFFHYESGQIRMGESIFKNYLGYISNSPIYYAEKVKTPLLSWTGEADTQVQYYQTIEFYLALRRLGKKHTMLIYPEQGHVLTSKEQQKHLTQSIKKWFDNYLEPKSSEIKYVE